MKDLDYLIKNALIIDGSGEKPFMGWMGICGDTVETVGAGNAPEAPASSTIDAEGKWLTPGFIDIHRHADYRVLEKDFGDWELFQGITSIVNGNCGMSGAPILPPYSAETMAYQLPIMGKMPLQGQEASAGDYLNALSSVRPRVNAGLLVGLGTVISSSSGISSSAAPVHKIRRYLEEALSGGACGVSLGIGYRPLIRCVEQQIVEYLAPVAGSGIPVCVHMRQEGDGMLSALSECIRICRALRCPMEISHLKAIGNKNRKTVMAEALGMLQRAREEGLDIAADIYPYTAGSTQLEHVLPPETVKNIRYAFDSSEARRYIAARIRSGTDYENIIALCGYENIVPCSFETEELKRAAGMPLSEGAAMFGMEPPEFLLYIFKLEPYSPAMLDYIICEEDIELALRDAAVSVISDSIYPPSGLMHPRVAGTYTRLLREYVLGKRVLTPEQAVKKASSLPASRVGLKNRGILKKGCKADACLISPEKLRERAEYGKELVCSEGTEFLFVNGRPAIENGKRTAVRAGEVLVRE